MIWATGHVGWQNPKVKTPHLDRLAKAGVQLNRHYVAPVCSPTRVALLTGRYWSRFGCNNALPSELDSTAVAMPPGTPTLERGTPGGRLPDRADREMASGRQP